MVNSRGSVLRIAVLVAIVVGNHILFTRISFSEYTFPLAGTIVYHSLQVIGSVYAGWISARYFSPSGIIAIVAGISVYFVGHIVIKEIDHFIAVVNGISLARQERAEYLRLLIYSFLMFSPLAGLFGFIGGKLGLRKRKNRG